MKKSGWLWGAAVAATLLVGALGYTLMHPAKDSRGILYRVTGETGEAYLLGSIHIGSADMYPFGEEIRQAMELADTFVYECDTTSPEAVTAVKARMALPEGETLKSQIGEALYAKLAQVCGTLTLNLTELDALKPWAVISTLAVASTAAELSGQNVQTALSLGVEEQVRALQQAGGKPSAYLETPIEQTDVLEGFSAELQRYLLQTELDTILSPGSATGMDASIGSWPAWWRDGDAEAFAAQYRQSYLAPGYEDVCAEYHRKLITQRNARMAERLDAMLKTGGTYFVTVGLLHLALPDDSLPALLSQMGYTVTRVGE